ncbi:hypothetical protein AB0442_24410 [Kitasatospora sp. NPDC085895]|uniref:hypothetical protein n=1 Tax=Kitasatospora sp. NPDC085895 TaxID=3155057 RepID=UPI00344FD0E6
METYIIRGTAGRPADCDACQKPVQRPIILETADRAGSPLGHHSHLGLDCAARRTGKDRKVVEAEAERANERRREAERHAARQEAVRLRIVRLERQWLQETYGADDMFDAAEKSGKDWEVVWEEFNEWEETQP